MQYLGAISRPTELFVCFKGKPFNITVIQVYAPTTSAKEAEWRPTSLPSPPLEEQADLIQMTIVSTTVGKNPLEERE